MRRKGQNLRCFINGACVAAETSLSITRGVDTEDASNKDLVGDSNVGGIAGTHPIAMYKNRTFQVEAQGNGAINLFARAKALMTSAGGAVGFADTKETNNRIVDGSVNYYQAICNDLTLNAPNKQPVTCTAQFMVISDTATGSGDTAPAATYEILRGEFVRLFFGASEKPIALATGFSLHLSLNMEDSSTKDDTSSMSSSDLDYKKQEPTTISYDISADSLYGGNGDAQDIAGMQEGNTFAWKAATAAGANQWDPVETLASGQAMLTNAGTQAATSQNITQNATFTGVGVLDDDSSSNNSSDNL